MGSYPLPLFRVLSSGVLSSEVLGFGCGGVSCWVLFLAFPNVFMKVSSAWVRAHLQKRSSSSRKGENGRVLVLGGSVFYAGAPALAGLGALRAGADLAFVLAPDAVASSVSCFSPDLIVWRYKGGVLNPSARPLFKKLAEQAGCIVVGNGLSKEPGALRQANYLVNLVDKPVVVDGDALGSVFHRRAVYTPHDGEFRRLSGAAPDTSLDERGDEVSSLSEKLGGVVLLKGPVDIISDGERQAFCKAGNAGMTHGGTGDVLAGVLGALLSQRYAPFEAACIAAFVNGAAGGLAYKEFGNGLLASDLPQCIAKVFKGLSH